LSTDFPSAADSKAATKYGGDFELYYDNDSALHTTNNNKTNDYKTNDSSTGHDPQKKPPPKGWVLDVGPAEYRRQCEAA